MNSELEALVRALDAVIQARGGEAEHLDAIYQAKLEEVYFDFPDYRAIA
jgi:hypothetical protein